MSKTKTSVKAAGSNKKAPDTIKVVTLALLKPKDETGCSMPNLLGETNHYCFIKDLPTNLTLEQYMQAVKAAVQRNLLPYGLKIRGWRQFAVYVELTEGSGLKVFDFEFPFSLDQSWDTTLDEIYDQAQVLKKNLITKKHGVASVEKSCFIEPVARKNDALRTKGGLEQEPSSADGKKPPIKPKAVPKCTRNDFDKVIGKNLILRVYNY